MKLRMNVSVAGVDFSLSSGDVTDRFETDEAMRLIAAGYAEEFKDTDVSEPPSGEVKIERAVKKQTVREKRDVVSR